MALGTSLDDAWGSWLKTQLDPAAAGAPMLPEQDPGFAPMEALPPAPLPIPPQQITAAPVPTEIAGPSAPAEPTGVPPLNDVWGQFTGATPAEGPRPESEPPQLDQASDPWAQVHESSPSSGPLDTTAQMAAALGFYDPQHILDNPDAEAGARTVQSLPPAAKEAVLEGYEAARLRKASDLEQQALEERTARTKAEEAAARRHLELQQNAKTETDAMLAEAKEIANTQIKPETGTARHVLMGVLGGLIQGRTGSSANAGLDMVNKEIDRDIALQRENLANRRAGLNQRQNLLAESLARTGDIEKAEATVRVAHYDAFIDGLQTEMGKYDPRGTAIVNLVAMRDKAAAERGKLAQKAFDTNLDRQIKIDNHTRDLRKESREGAKTAAEIAKMEAETAKLRGVGGGAGGGGGAAASDVYDRARAASEGFTVLPPEGVKFKNREDYAGWLGARGKDKLLTAEERKNALEEEQRLQKYSIGDATGAPIKNDNGSVFAPTEDEHKALTAQKNAGEELADILRQIKNHRDENGGANQWTSPDAQAEYKRLGNRAVIAFAAANHLSTSDEQSIKYARDAIFGSDPSDYNIGDLNKRIDKAIAETNDSLNRALRTAKYKGSPVKFLTPGKPKNSRTQQLVQDAAASGNEVGLGRVGAEIAARQRDFAPTAEEKSSVDEVAAPAFGSDPKARMEAIAALRDMAEHSGSQTQRGYALSVFHEATGGKHAAATPAAAPPVREPVHARPAKDAALMQGEQDPLLRLGQQGSGPRPVLDAEPWRTK